MPVPLRAAFVHQVSDIGAPSAENVDFVVIQTHLFLWFLIGPKTSKRFTSIRLPAAAADQPQDVGKQISRDSDLGHLERDIAPMADDFRADFDELLFQGRHRPVLDRLRRRQCSQEVAEIIASA